MTTLRHHVSLQGKIALPLIILAALCFLDSCLHAVDYERISWLVCLVLSFPLGWVAEWLTQSIAEGSRTTIELMRFVVVVGSSALNVYLLAAFITLLFHKRTVSDITGSVR